MRSQSRCTASTLYIRTLWMQAVREGRVNCGVGKDAVVLKPGDLTFPK